MSRKRETYHLAFRDDLRQTTVDLNHIFRQLEDRLDLLEALRLDYFTTQRWEKDFLKEV